MTFEGNLFHSTAVEKKLANLPFSLLRPAEDKVKVGVLRPFNSQCHIFGQVIGIVA